MSVQIYINNRALFVALINLEVHINDCMILEINIGLTYLEYYVKVNVITTGRANTEIPALRLSELMNPKIR